MKDKNGILKGAFILGLGTFIAKLLGALYRVPLTNLIGGYGLGLYQMVFPVYSVLLDFSGAGAPNAISKLVSSEKNGNDVKILTVSKRLLAVFAFISFLLMFSLSKALSTAQGNVGATLAYVTLSPAVIGVCLISCYRGFFQGHMNMYPTAISQVIEQLIKITLGILLVYLALPSVEKAVSGATLAITVSEFIALFFLIIYYHKSFSNRVRPIIDKKEFRQISLKIIKYALPVTLIGIILPFSQIADSFIIINVLKTYLDNATSLYGLLSGVALTVINLPVSLCHGVACSSIPAISRENNLALKKTKSKKAVLFTVLLTLPCATVCFFFSRNVVELLFKNLPSLEKSISSNLIKILSVNIILLSVLQTLNAILIANDLIYKPVISMSIGVLAKIIIEFILLKNQKINIYAGAIGLIACYFIAVLINLIIVRFKVYKNADKTNSNRKHPNEE